LKAKCVPNATNALVFDAEAEDFQTRNKLIPISTYNGVQTSPKTQLGGLYSGLTNCPYQESSLVTVDTAPIAAAEKGMRIEIIKVIAVFT